MRKLLGALGVDPGEEMLTALLWLHAFLMGLSLFLFQTAGEAMLVGRVGAQGLPYVYIGWAVAVPATGFAYAWAQKRVPVATLWTGVLVFCITLIGGLTVLLGFTRSAWPSTRFASSRVRAYPAEPAAWRSYTRSK